MKKTCVLLAFMVASTIFISCNSDPDSDLKGLVGFADNPKYSNDVITFAAQIQYGFAGESIEIEYKIMSGETEIYNDKKIANINPDGMGLWFETDPISHNLPSSQYSGQTITVWLDPDNKITSPEYTTEAYIDLYKKESLTIP